MDSQSRSERRASIKNISSLTTTLRDKSYILLLPFTNPIGAYELIGGSIVMGLFGTSFSTKEIPDLSGKVYFVTGGS